jgi:hypothetical protein
MDDKYFYFINQLSYKPTPGAAGMGKPRVLEWHCLGEGSWQR